MTKGNSSWVERVCKERHARGSVVSPSSTSPAITVLFPPKRPMVITSLSSAIMVEVYFENQTGNTVGS